MTTEITRGKAAYTYRISPADSCLIERRLNQAGAHWEEVQRYQYPRRASSELLRLSQGGRVREPKPVKQLPAKTSKPVKELPSPYADLRYDYGQIEEAHRQTVQDTALDIRRRRRGRERGGVEVGAACAMPTRLNG